MKPSDGIAQLERKLAENPAGKIFLPLAEQHRKKGRFKRAIEILRAGLQHNPAYTAAEVALARALVSTGEPEAVEEARTILTLVQRDVPDNLLAQRLLEEAGGPVDLDALEAEAAAKEEAEASAREAQEEAEAAAQRESEAAAREAEAAAQKEAEVAAKEAEVAAREAEAAAAGQPQGPEAETGPEAVWAQDPESESASSPGRPEATELAAETDGEAVWSAEPEEPDGMAAAAGGRQDGGTEQDTDDIEPVADSGWETHGEPPSCDVEPPPYETVRLSRAQIEAKLAEAQGEVAFELSETGLPESPDGLEAETLAPGHPDLQPDHPDRQDEAQEGAGEDLFDVAAPEIQTGTGGGEIEDVDDAIDSDPVFAPDAGLDAEPASDRFPEAGEAAGDVDLAAEAEVPAALEEIADDDIVLSPPEDPYADEEPEEARRRRVRFLKSWLDYIRAEG